MSLPLVHAGQSGGCTSTFTIDEVIARSIELHPTLFAEATGKAADVHLAFVMHTHDREAERIASDMADKLAGFADQLLAGVAGVQDDFGLRIMLLDIARKLQCLPVHAIALD
jgi:hypothetical protein